LLVAISACTTTTTGGDDAGGTGPLISPRAGAWTSGNVTVVSNTCGAQGHAPDSTFDMIDQVTATSFRVVPSDGTPPFTCTASGAQYSCPIASSVMDLRPTIDAVVTVHVAATATFMDSSHGSVKADLTIDCSGTQCGQMGGSCDYKVEFPVQAQ
jgi:hypothetical protein